jgi:GNAT superfamily N-acetyltransferase
MTDVFFDSFNQAFWTHILPDNKSNRSFIVDMWTKGMYASTDRTFVAVDTADSNRIIGVSRWQAPLYDRTPEVCDSWPEPSMLDQDIAVYLFRAEDLSRRTIMGDRPHWCEWDISTAGPAESMTELTDQVDLDIIGINQSYQGRGVGKTLMDWGVEKADKDRIEVFLHGTESARDFYQKVRSKPNIANRFCEIAKFSSKQYGFKVFGEIQVPDHPTYGTYQHASMVRVPSSQKVIHSGKL